MDATAHEAGHEALATLVARCRQLCDFVDEVAESIASDGSNSFLRGQLEEVMHELTRSLRRLGCLGEDLEARSEEEGVRPVRPDRRGRAASLEGSAWSIPISEFVSFLSSNGKTGILWVTAPEELFMLEFRDGLLVRGSSDRSPEGQRLGDVLVRLGHLDEDEVPALVAEAKENFRHLGSYLVDIGRVSVNDMQRALATQVQALFYRLMASKHAVYRFQEGNELTDAQDLDMSVMHLLLEGARFIDERDHEARRSDPGVAAPEAELETTDEDEESEEDEVRAEDDGDAEDDADREDEDEAA